MINFDPLTCPPNASAHSPPSVPSLMHLRIALLPYLLYLAQSAAVSPCLTQFTLDNIEHCSMNIDDALTAITNKNTDVVERRVQASCTTAGLSAKDCTRLMGATLKSVGEEVAWREDRNSRPSLLDLDPDRRIESREDAIQMLSDWGWGSTVWLFGDSHMRKMTRTLLRALDVDSKTRQVVGNHQDCGVACWCPTIFRISNGGHVERLAFPGAAASSSSPAASITLVFRYFVVTRDDAWSANTLYGTYDRPCVFKEGATTMKETIHQWRQHKSSALVDPDVIVFNAGNWESKEEWEVDAFEHDVRRRAEALRTAFLPLQGDSRNKKKQKLIFLGPPFFNDGIPHLKECPGKWAPTTSTRMAALNKVAVRSLRAIGVAVLDVFALTEEVSSKQVAFWQSLGWAGAVRYELCSNHQTPSMYRYFWRLIAAVVGAGEGGGGEL